MSMRFMAVSLLIKLSSVRNTNNIQSSHTCKLVKKIFGCKLIIFSAHTHQWHAWPHVPPSAEAVPDFAPARSWGFLIAPTGSHPH